MRWLGLFAKKTLRKHLNLIFLHMDFIICIVSLTIFRPHFVIRISSSTFYHPHFIIHILSSAFFHPHFIIRIFLSAIRHPPLSGLHFTEGWKNVIRGSWLDVSHFSQVGKSIRDIWLVYIGLRTNIYSAAFQCVNLSMYIIIYVNTWKQYLLIMECFAKSIYCKYYM